VTNRKRTTLLAAAVAIAAIAAPAAQAVTATSARTQSVHESATLHRVSRHGTTVVEAGAGSGTFTCPISVRIEVEENTLQFSFTCETHTNSISGAGTIHLHAADPTSRVTGTVLLDHGRGAWSHDEGHGLSVSGTVNSRTYAGTLLVTGTMSV
jgi:hypothetical protein